MLIDYEILKWLVDSKVLIQSEKPIIRPDNKVLLDQKCADMIQNGLIFAKLIRALKRLAQSLSKTPIQTPPNLKQLKDANTSAARVYNWNIIVEALAKLNYKIDNDIKSLIIAGDEDMVMEVLKEVYRFMMKFGKLGMKEKPSTAASSVASSEVIDRLNQRYPTQKTLAESVTSGPIQVKHSTSYKVLHGKPDVVDLNHLNVDAPLEDAGTLMELLVISLGKSLSLNSKQAVALLANGNKYLAHVVAKGIKGNFDPVSTWYKDLYSQSKHILQLIIKEEGTGSMNTLLQALKPGLYSKSEEVAQATCRLLSKLASDFSNVGILQLAWEWFISTGGGLYAFLACLKRQSDISSVIVSAIIQFGRFNLLEMFTVEMKKIFVEPLEYIQNILLLLKPLTEVKNSKDELLSHGIIDYFINLGLKHSDASDRSASSEIRSAALALLCDLWEIYPNKIEQQEGLANQILLVAKKGIRDNYNSLKIICVTYLFRLLETFAGERNPYAPIVYKILTFSLIEHHEDQTLREHIMLNFVQIFRTFSSIPVGVLLEPLAKQIQVSEGSTFMLNLFDFKLLDTLAGHTKLTLKQGILLLDVLAKAYLNNVSLGPLAGVPFQKIAEKFVEDEAMQEYLLEFGKLALSKFYTTIKKRKIKDNSVKKYVYMGDKDALFAGPTNLTPEVEQEIVNAQKRALTINMLRDVIKYHCNPLNSKFKTLILYTNTQIKQITRHDNKGLRSLIALFGDPNEIIRDYEQEMSQTNEERRVVDSHQRHSSEFTGPKDITRTSIAKTVTGSPKHSEKGSPGKQRGRRSSPKENYEQVHRSMDQKSEISEIVRQKQSVRGSPVSQSQNKTSGDLRRDSWDQVNVDGPLDITNLKSISMNEDVDEKASEVMGRDERRTNRGKAKEIAEAKKKDKEASDALRFMKAIEQLEGIKKKKNEEKMSKEMMEEYKRLKEEKTKEVLKKKIDQRRMELGVQAKTNNMLITEEEHHEVKAPVKKREARDIEGMMIVDLDEEEYFQKEAITIYIKQNIKKFKYLFNKYCLTGAAYQKEKSFDKLRVQYNTINQVALLRMVKDNGLHTSISKEEVTQLLKLVNTKLLGNQDFEPLNLEGFIKFVVQLGIYINTRPPIDQAHPIYADCVKKMMFVIYLAAQGRGEHKLMLEEGSVPGEDKHELEMLNKQIQENPNMNLPPKYRRVMENTVEYEHFMPQKLSGLQKYKLAYEMLDEILHAEFGFHIVESKAIFSTHIKVVPHVKTEVVAPKPKVGKEEEERNEHRENRGRSIDPERKNAEGSRSNREISVDRVAQKAEGKIVNKVMEEKMKKAEEERKKQEELDKKIKQRKLEVDAKMKEMMEMKKEKELKKEEEKKNELRQKEEQERQKEELRKKELEKKKQVLNAYKEKKDLEHKQAEEAEKEKNVKKAEQKKEQAMAVKKQTEIAQKQFEDKKKKREEEEKLKQQKLEEEKKKEELNKKKLEVKLEKDKEKREREKEIANQLQKLFESASVQEFFSQNYKRLNFVFKHYKESPERDIITFKEFMIMGAQLNIFPSLISSEEFKLIFRSLTRDKTGELGLTYTDFLQTLLRVSIKSQTILNKIAEKFQARKGEEDSRQDEVRDIMNRAREANGQDAITQEEEKEAQGMENYDKNTIEKDSVDEYHGIADFKRESLEGLIIYLDLPTDLNKLNFKLRSLRTENQKIIAPRDKKRVAIQSVGGPVQSAHPNRSASPINRDVAQPNKETVVPNKQGGGGQKAGGKPPLAGHATQDKKNPPPASKEPVQDEELAAFDPRDLSLEPRGDHNSDNDSPIRDAMIIAPDGEKEKWGIKNAKK